MIANSAALAFGRRPSRPGAVGMEIPKLTPYEYICALWTKEPQRFKLNPHHLSGTNLRRADFTGAYISYDNILHPSSLIEADLTGALLNGVNLKESQYNHRTIFPLGFDPSANGMVLVNKKQGLIVPTITSRTKKSR